MPRPGGESAKLGDQYDAVWTVDAAIDVFEGRFRSITVEAFGDASVGVEFHLETNDGVFQFHSVKRQRDGGDWSVTDLCRKDNNTGRSILGDLIAKRTRWPNAETRFVSATGANELRELEDRAKTPTNIAEFKGILSVKLQSEFDSRVRLCSRRQLQHDTADLSRAIARVNRVFRDIQGWLIVDYLGLRKYTILLSRKICA